MRNLPSGLDTFSLGRGGLKCLPITCLILKGPNPDPTEIRGAVAVSLVGQELNSAIRVAQKTWTHGGRQKVAWECFGSVKTLPRSLGSGDTWKNHGGCS